MNNYNEIIYMYNKFLKEQNTEYKGYLACWIMMLYQTLNETQKNQLSKMFNEILEWL